MFTKETATIYLWIKNTLQGCIPPSGGQDDYGGHSRAKEMEDLYPDRIKQQSEANNIIHLETNTILIGLKKGVRC